MFDNGLISAPTIQQADINGYVIREQMAKMITEFAIKVLNKKPNSLLACSFTDTKNESTEMSFYIKTACQLGLM